MVHATKNSLRRRKKKSQLSKESESRVLAYSKLCLIWGLFIQIDIQ